LILLYDQNRLGIMPRPQISEGHHDNFSLYGYALSTNSTHY
jgi:hypothetical protein